MKLRTFLMAGLVTLSLVLPASALTLSVDGRDRTAEAKTTAIQNTTYVSLRSGPDCPGGLEGRKGVGDH